MLFNELHQKSFWYSGDKNALWRNKKFIIKNFAEYEYSY